MDSMIKIFENEKFGKIRTLIINGDPWFILADICKVLEISNSRMVAGRLDEDAAIVKGTIDTIPEVPGLAVWQDGHIGIYIGNGEVIEAMGTEQGVVKTTLPSGWTHWLEIPYISYSVEEETIAEPTEEGE